jgi:hypothetical protein
MSVQIEQCQRTYSARAERKLAADRHHYRKKRTIVATKLTTRYTHIIKNKQQRVSTQPETHRWSSSKHSHHRKAAPALINTATAKHQSRTIGFPVEVKLLLGDAAVADLADPHQLAHLIVIYSSVFSGRKVSNCRKSELNMIDHVFHCVCDNW